MTWSPTPRVGRLLDAAVTVVAEGGLRGLTHRAVDRAAGLPEGSCSAYLRTRHALLTALAEHVNAGLTADVGELAATLRQSPGDHERATGALAALFDRWLREPALAARFELALEAGRDPRLAAALAPWRARLVQVVAELLVAAGTPRAPERADTLVASLEGVLLGATLRDEETREDYLRRSVTLLLDGLSPSGAPGAVSPG